MEGSEISPGKEWQPPPIPFYAARGSFGKPFSEILEQIVLFRGSATMWLTFLSLFIRPGQVCTDYIRGKRRPYVNPISYFLIGASIQLVSLWFTAPLIRQSVSESIQNGRLNAEQAKQFQTLDDAVGGDSAACMGDVYLTVMAQGYTYLAFFAFTCPLAFCLWQGHRRLGSKYHFAEVMVFSLYGGVHCVAQMDRHLRQVTD